MGWYMVIGLGIGSTGIGIVLYLWVVEKCGPSTLAKINYFPPVVSVIAGVWLLAEDFQYRAVIALAIILLGVFIARPKRQPRQAKPPLN